jgi:hypothetical protein
LKILAAKYPDLLEMQWASVDKWTAYLPYAVAPLSSDELMMADEDRIPAVFLDQRMIGYHAGDESICGVCAATLLINVSFSFNT